MINNDKGDLKNHHSLLPIIGKFTILILPAFPAAIIINEQVLSIKDTIFEYTFEFSFLCGQYTFPMRSSVSKVTVVVITIFVIYPTNCYLGGVVFVSLVLTEFYVLCFHVVFVVGFEISLFLFYFAVRHH